MFNNGLNPRKRVWQCYVCGGKHEDYGSYAEHIITEHDEGRDFVMCPVDMCKAPVRDLKVHFSTKHPSRVMPKNCQTKATIWRDFSTNSKKPRVRKPAFKTGWFESKKNGGAQIYYRSGYEADVYKCLEADKDIKSFKAEPFKVPYYFQNEWHNYLPDIKVEYQDGVVEIWEIKPNTQRGLEQNKAKWKAMNDYARNLGWTFNVITETGINILKNKVRNQGMI